MKLTVHGPNGAVRHIEAKEGETLLEALRASGETIFAPCGGAGTCGRCQVLVRDGQGAGYRLACQTVAADNLEIIPQNMDTLPVEGGSPAEAAGEPRGEDLGSLGLAIDIGTTTMALYLVDRNAHQVIQVVGKVNPQVSFGADVIARIEAASEPEGLQALCRALRGGIDDALAALCRPLRIHRALDDFEHIAVVGNTVMEHFACGLNPRTIGVAPFAPLSLFGCDCRRYEKGILPAQAYVAPAVAGYVGGDIAAGLHSAGMARSDSLQLFVDIGTNGEMALGSSDRIICCATAAGPTFEGAGITFGMPAFEGAINAVSIERAMIAVETVGGSAPVGICGSGLIDAIACLLELGLIDETGRLLERGEIDPHFEHLIGEERGRTACYLDGRRRVYVTQEDVRKVQLAKAAIRAGIETMLAELQVSACEVSRIALAGGFGAHLNPTSMARIGLIPPELEDRIEVLGNAAGQGAVAALESEGRESLERIAASCEYLELSTSAAFSAFYLDSMEFGA